MKFDATNLALLAAASTTAVSAFAPLHAAATESHSTRLKATVEQTSSSTGLVPPLSPSDIVNEDGRVSELYDGNVQKTYG